MIAILAAISGGGLIGLLIQFLVVGLICWLLLWLVDYIGLPAPFGKVAKVLIAVIAVIFIINLLLSLTGNGFITF